MFGDAPSPTSSPCPRCPNGHMVITAEAGAQPAATGRDRVALNVSVRSTPTHWKARLGSFYHSAPLEGVCRGEGGGVPHHPPTPHENIGPNLTPGLWNENFSLDPLAPTSLDQKFSSAPLTTQHHWGEVRGGWGDGPNHPPLTPFSQCRTMGSRLGTKTSHSRSVVRVRVTELVEPVLVL